MKLLNTADELFIYLFIIIHLYFPPGLKKNPMNFGFMQKKIFIRLTYSSYQQCRLQPCLK